MPALLLRIGFVGELGYEIHCSEPVRRAPVGRDPRAGADLGVEPFGLEPQRILRLEKMHVIVGQDTDSESNLLDAGMPWIVKLDKDDFVGKWSLEQVAGARASASSSSASRWRTARCRRRAARSWSTGEPAGRVTSARWSEELGGAIGLAWVPTELAEEGTTLEIRVDGRARAAQRRACSRSTTRRGRKLRS